MNFGIKDWVKKISEDKNFAKKFEGKNAKETAELARKEGFNFTPEEYMDLKMEAAAGGFDFDSFFEKVEDRFNKVTEVTEKVASGVSTASKIANSLSDRPVKGIELLDYLEKIRSENSGL